MLNNFSINQAFLLENGKFLIIRVKDFVKNTWRGYSSCRKNRHQTPR